MFNPGAAMIAQPDSTSPSCRKFGTGSGAAPRSAERRAGANWEVGTAGGNALAIRFSSLLREWGIWAYGGDATDAHSDRFAGDDVSPAIVRGDFSRRPHEGRDADGSG